MKQSVEFYVLRSDRTWVTETVTLEGEALREAIEQDDVVALARGRAEELFKTIPNFECVGPVYHIGNVEEE